MSKQLFTLLIMFLFSWLCADEALRRCYEFSDAAGLKREWMNKGKQFGIPMTRFFVRASKEARDKRVLVVEAKKSSGILVTRIPEEVWEKFPVMRWRWRVLKKIEFKSKELDDQAAVIYFGDGTMLKQFLLGYRWEHFPAVGSSSTIKYGMGSTTVFRTCMRNQKAELGKWYVEERNVVQDFQKAFGRMPDGDCALTIGGNSQYSRSTAIVEIDYIEFLAAEKKAPAPAKITIDIAERKREK